MKFVNRQFGEFEFDEKHVLEFPEGIIGFGDCKRFLIVDDEDSQPFRWLVSLEDSDLSFALIDPNLVLSEFQPTHFQGGNTTVFLIVALREPLEQSTLNLRSPVVIDNATRKGRQVILEDETLAMKYPLFARTAEIVE